MKKMSFLNKLYKKKKLQIIEPSENVKTAYLQRSDESLTSAKTLLEIGNLKDSVALSYYSMYHCLLALLFRVGIKCENHTAAIILLRKVFEIDNMKISKSKEERVDKQYSVGFRIEQEEAQDSINTAEEFITGIIEFIDKLNEEDIQDYRKRARDIIQ